MVDSLFFVVWYTSWALLILVFVRVIFFVTFSARHHIKHRRIHPRSLTGVPLASVIVPCYNEGVTLENCIDSLMKQTYPNYEVIIVNDGSTDNTRTVARRLARKYSNIRVRNKKNGGKASALNAGIAKAQGSIIVCIDADSMFLPDTVAQLVLSFQGSDVAAVGGNVKVASRRGILARQQALEYITGLTLQRQAFSYLGCMQVISGAVGAFRKDVLEVIGKYSDDTIVEDMDITIELVTRGYRVVYNPSAIAYTEAPGSLKDFLKQRYRWTYGRYQALAKHRRSIWRPGYMGYIGLPYFMIFPWVEVVVSALFLIVLALAAMTGNFSDMFIMFAFMCSLQLGLVLYALSMDKEDKRLGILTIIDSLFYYHLVSFTTLRAGINYVLKREAKWNKLQRYGRNAMPLNPALAAQSASGSLEGGVLKVTMKQQDRT